VLEHPLDGVVVLRGGVLGWPELGAEKRGARRQQARFMADTVGSGGRAAGDATQR
jgi:hypothetical protein